MTKREIPSAPSRATPAREAALDIPEQFAKLTALKDEGILSDEEFQWKKTELLRRL
jgi:hypothetical protein